ncbi:MAG TPA: carboxymuconolactone decarboxylase family protein [Longimicrobiales bacterium]|nr:carboxymuconolactone decarboxylase family protein [Longimicrobiales bacterium]
MQAIVDLPRSAPEVIEALESPRRYLVRKSDLEPEIMVLIQIYVSYLNGCARCGDGYARQARRAGEGQERIRCVPSWRNAAAGLYSRREITALAWAEALILLDNEEEWPALRRRARTTFSERDLADLTLAVVSTAGWNRVAIALDTLPPGAEMRRPDAARPPAHAAGDAAGRGARPAAARPFRTASSGVRT